LEHRDPGTESAKIPRRRIAEGIGEAGPASLAPAFDIGLVVGGDDRVQRLHDEGAVGLEQIRHALDELRYALLAEEREVADDQVEAAAAEARFGDLLVSGDLEAGLAPFLRALDQRRNRVDAEHVKAAIGEFVGKPAFAAGEIENGPRLAIDDDGDRCSIGRAHTARNLAVAHGLRPRRGVRGPGRQDVGFGHGWAPIREREMPT
jgi:hypothetical protein